MPHGGDRFLMYCCAQFDSDLASEPDRIRAFYPVKAHRVQPVCRWPESN